jgi:hypothetical protein
MPASFITGFFAVAKKAARLFHCHSLHRLKRKYSKENKTVSELKRKTPKGRMGKSECLFYTNPYKNHQVRYKNISDSMASFDIQYVCWSSTTSGS